MYGPDLLGEKISEPVPPESLPPNGDPGLERLRSDISCAIRKICPRWLMDETEDLTQIAMMRVLSRIRATAGSMVYTSAYVYQVAYSALVDEIRRRRRLREEPLDLVSPPGPRTDNPELYAKDREVRTAVARCLSALKKSRRRVVMLYLQGHPIAETSALLDCTPKKTGNLLYRGLKELRACLDAHGVKP